MNSAGKLKSVLEVIHRVFLAVSGVGLSAMVLMISLDVFLRYLFNAPLPASVEISQLIEPYVVFLPFAFALTIGAHVHVSLLTSRLRGRAKAFSEILTYISGACFFSAITYWSWLLFWESFSVNEQMLASIPLPWWVGKLAMPLGLVAMTFQCVYYIFNPLKEKK